MKISEIKREKLLQEIYELFFVEKREIKYIAKVLNKSTQRISQILKEHFNEEYEKEKKERSNRKKERRREYNNNYRKIQIEKEKEEKTKKYIEISQEFINYISMNYFNLFDKDAEAFIAKKYNIDIAKVEDILENTIHEFYESIKKIREEAENYSLIMNHINDVKMMSKTGTISVTAAWFFISSAYTMDALNCVYHYNNKYGSRPADLPKKIKTILYVDQVKQSIKDKIQKEKFSSIVEENIIKKFEMNFKNYIDLIEKKAAATDCTQLR